MICLPRICPIGIAQHIIQRGNNRQICFGSEQDFFAYVGGLKESPVTCRVDIHAWVLMTNHVHLLCTPHEAGGVSQMMQALGKQYVRYFHHCFNRTVALWKGRFKSCLVENEAYLIQLYRYIELNPISFNLTLF
jgi:putative transposase